MYIVREPVEEGVGDQFGKEQAEGLDWSEVAWQFFTSPEGELHNSRYRESSKKADSLFITPTSHLHKRDSLNLASFKWIEAFACTSILSLWVGSSSLSPSSSSRRGLVSELSIGISLNDDDQTHDERFECISVFPPPPETQGLVALGPSPEREESLLQLL